LPRAFTLAALIAAEAPPAAPVALMQKPLDQNIADRPAQRPVSGARKFTAVWKTRSL
jgi:hypothetical protein